jgi:hypothetical protein
MEQLIHDDTQCPDVHHLVVIVAIGRLQNLRRHVVQRPHLRRERVAGKGVDNNMRASSNVRISFP